MGYYQILKKTYGTCLYLINTDIVGKHEVKLICAKSRVVPLKIVFLPRLELCATLLLARLCFQVIPKLNLKISRRRFLTDSKIVLAWITSPSSR